MMLLNAVLNLSAKLENSSVATGMKKGQFSFQSQRRAMPKNVQTNSQQVYKKMLNITIHQENGNQHHNEMSPHTH